MFGTNKTTDVVSIEAERLQAYARAEHAGRSVSPYDGPVYYQELEAIPLQGLRVLEFGCGAGVDSLYFAEQGAFIVACDVVPSNVAVTQKVLAQYPETARVLLMSDYEKLAELGRFDLVYSHGCLHHISPGAVAEVAALLVSCLGAGGRLLVMLYTKTFYPSVNYHQVREGPYTQGYDEAELTRLFGPSVRLQSYRVLCNGCFSWALLQK